MFTQSKTVIWLDDGTLTIDSVLDTELAASWVLFDAVLSGRRTNTDTTNNTKTETRTWTLILQKA